jgi:hypothetical protein
MLMYMVYHVVYHPVKRYATDMGFPVGPWTNVLMVATATELGQESWAGRLPNVTPGQAFWATSRDVPSLLASGQAILAPPDTVAPPAEPAWTAHGQPGFGAGTSNSSHSWTPAPGGNADGGPAFTASQSWGGVIDGGPDAQGGSPDGTVDGGDS